MLMVLAFVIDVAAPELLPKQIPRTHIYKRHREYRNKATSKMSK